MVAVIVAIMPVSRNGSPNKKHVKTKSKNQRKMTMRMEKRKESGIQWKSQHHMSHVNVLRAKWYDHQDDM